MASSSSSSRSARCAASLKRCFERLLPRCCHPAPSPPLPVTPSHDVEQKLQQITPDDLDVLHASIKAVLQERRGRTSSDTNSLSARVLKWQEHKDVAESFINTIPPDPSQEVVGTMLLLIK
eukprot:c44571_g1_i1 orf=1-360(-)